MFNKAFKKCVDGRYASINFNMEDLDDSDNWQSQIKMVIWKLKWETKTIASTTENFMYVDAEMKGTSEINIRSCAKHWFRQNFIYSDSKIATTPPYQILLFIGPIVGRITYQAFPSLSVTLILVAMVSPDIHQDVRPLFLRQQPSRGQSNGIVTRSGRSAS
jgi:hypothetical protein